MNRTRWTWILAAALIASTALPHPSLANVQEVSGISPKATAMGNAYAAVADDFSACYYNPAGLGQHDHHGMFVGYMWVKPYMKQYLVSSPDVENARGYENYRSLVFGSLLDLTAIFDTRGHNLVLGVAATAGDNFKVGWRIHDWNPSVPRFIRSGDIMNRNHVYTALGLEVLKDLLYVGAGINLYEDLIPRIRVIMDSSGNMIYDETISSGDFEISPIVGVLVKPLNWLSIAYTFRQGWKQSIPMLSEYEIQLLDNLSLGLLVEISLQDYFLPWNMTGAVAIRPTERLLFSIDMTYYNWSSFTVPSWRGPIKQWSNTLVPRVGAQVRVWDALVARGGYYLDPSPVPDQSDVRSNYLDFDKHVLSVGLGYVFRSIPWIGKRPLPHPIEIDGYLQYQIMPRRAQLKSEATGQEGWYIEGYGYAMGIGLSMGF